MEGQEGIQLYVHTSPSFKCLHKQASRHNTHSNTIDTTHNHARHNMWAIIH